jgi:Na+/melibiose symporter-like transporter
MSISETSPRVLWIQVWGLAAVQGAIALTWVIYNLYLLQLLTDFGFPKGFATGVLILENILAAVMEPLMGGAF